MSNEESVRIYQVPSIPGKQKVLYNDLERTPGISSVVGGPIYE